MLCATFSLSLAGIIAGSLTVRERAEKVISGTDYAVVTFSSEGEQKSRKSGKTELFVDLSFSKERELLKKAIPFTPFGALWLFLNE